MKLNTTLAAALIAAFAGGALAQTAPQTPRVDQREVKQQQRIDQGVASGQLTAKETAHLENGQARVDAKEAKAKSDGVVTAKERAQLKKAQDKQSQKIYAQKHDKQTKPAPAAAPAK
jgi:hypothetical protein